MSDQRAVVIDDEQRILAIRISMIVRLLEFEVEHGMPLTNKAPTVKALREQYGISAKTKKQAIPQLRELLAAQERECGIYGD